MLQQVAENLSQASLGFGNPVRARAASGPDAQQLPSSILLQVEQSDLINYGLIPEFVGRFPVVCSLQVRRQPFFITSSNSKAAPLCVLHSMRQVFMQTEAGRASRTSAGNCAAQSKCQCQAIKGAMNDRFCAMLAPRR